MKLIELNKSFYSFPTSWDELTGKQLVQVMEVMYLKNYKAEQMLLQLVRVLAGLSNFQFFRCKVEELEEYFYLLSFLLQEEISFTKNLLPEYAHKERMGNTISFFGPDDALGNMRMKEFSFAEDWFLAWCDSEKKDTAALDKFIACIYRPAKQGYDHKQNPDGDRRISFNENLLDWYIKKYISLWPMSIKLAIATWYHGCRHAITAQYPEVFGDGAGEPSRFGLVSVMLNVAEGKVFGDFDKVEEQHVTIVLMHLTEVTLQAQRLEKNKPA